MKGPVWLAFRVFDEPGRVFSQLAERPRAAVPILMTVAVAFMTAFLTPDDVLSAGAQRVIAAIEQRTDERLSPDDRAEALAEAAGPTNRMLVFAMNAGAGIITLLTITVVLQVVYSTAAPTPLRFKDELAIVAHSFMVQALGSLVTLGVVILTSSTTSSSLGFLFDRDAHPFFFRLANGLTVFGAWTVCLVALGNKIKLKSEGLAGPLAIVAGLWVIFKVGLTALWMWAAPAVTVSP
jgi:hypothetical protein